MNLVEFRTRYPEFPAASVPDPLVNDALARATSRVDPEVYAHTTEEAIGLLAAHLLATSPNGQMARLVSDKGESTYGREFEKMKLSATCALRVL